MILQHEISVKCTDKLDNYQYDVLLRGNKAATIVDDDEMHWAVISVTGDSIDEIRLVQNAGMISTLEFEDPNTHVISINQSCCH